MTNCPYCNTYVGAAGKCPNCGAGIQRQPQAAPPVQQQPQQPPKKSRRPLIIAIIAILVVLILITGVVVAIVLLTGDSPEDKENGDDKKNGGLDLDVEMTADKTKVAQDGSVLLTVTITNDGEEDFPKEGYFMDITIVVEKEYISGAYGYHYSPDGVPEEIVENAVVKAGETVELELEWKMSNRDPDDYVIVFSVNRIISEEEDYMQSITVTEKAVPVEVTE